LRHCARKAVEDESLATRVLVEALGPAQAEGRKTGK